MTTDFSKKIEILGDFYTQFRDNEKMKEFIEFNDVGLPLAYLTAEGLCEITEDGKKYVAETWDLFLGIIGIKDTGFEHITEIWAAGEDTP
ncbi:MAG: hypothetical protein EBY03_05915 [Actinobacteria bacterium]|jgi:hypothetical protein|nr:hypothetical protein [Actinomycetota bacterium]NDH99862.1 hypothetical protein [Actinomycetota bacterium]